MKVFTNSYPRSGATTFVNALIGATRNMRPEFEDELCSNPDWILKNHNPLLFLGTYANDIIPVTIIRDPVDAISSNSYRWSKGYIGNVIHGVAIIDKNQIHSKLEIDSRMAQSIDHQINQYISYMQSLLSNGDNFYCFSYEQIQKYPEKCINILVKMAGLSSNSINLKAIQQVFNNPPDPTGPKTEFYDKIRTYINKHSKLSEMYELYNKAMNRILVV